MLKLTKGWLRKDIRQDKRNSLENMAELNSRTTKYEGATSHGFSWR
jgi:hypothetical protein